MHEAVSSSAVILAEAPGPTRSTWSLHLSEARERVAVRAWSMHQQAEAVEPARHDLSNKINQAEYLSLDRRSTQQAASASSSRTGGPEHRAQAPDVACLGALPSRHHLGGAPAPATQPLSSRLKPQVQAARQVRAPAPADCRQARRAQGGALCRRAEEQGGAGQCLQQTLMWRAVRRMGVSL